MDQSGAALFSPLEILNSFKKNLSDARYRVFLDDQVRSVVRSTMDEISGDRFSHSAQVSESEFVTRLTAYESALRGLQEMTALLAQWATPEQLPILRKLLHCMYEGIARPPGGQSVWENLRCYPLAMLLYTAGIASLSNENYLAFSAGQLLWIPARAHEYQGGGPIFAKVVDAFRQILNANLWNLVEDYQRLRVPDSERLFKALNPLFSGLLYGGATYERLFDRYEILRTLIFADLANHGRGPLGRFAWKYYSDQENPFADLCAEAAREKSEWGPFRVGLFQGSYDRFKEIAEKYEREFLSRLNWR